MGSILDRLKTFITWKEISIRKFEIAVGMSNGTLHNAFVKGTTISAGWIEKITRAYPEINATWLVTGEGCMLRRDEAKSKIKGAPFYDVDFIGGFNEIFNDTTLVPTSYIDCPELNREGLMWCRLHGHSMEPTIADGDRLAMYEMAGKFSDVAYGQIYGFVTPDLRTVKRLERGTSDDNVMLVADNKDYNSNIVAKRDVLHVFRIVAHMGLF